MPTPHAKECATSPGRAQSLVGTTYFRVRRNQHASSDSTTMEGDVELGSELFKRVHRR